MSFSSDKLPCVALIDDEPGAAALMATLLSELMTSIEFRAFRKPDELLSFCESRLPEVVITDLSLNPKEGVESGFSVVSQLQRLDSSCRVIVLTGHGEAKYGVRALNLGAASFLQKPADPAHLAALVRDGIEQARLRRSVVSTQDGELSLEEILVGTSSAIEHVRKQIRFVARTNQSVLLTGETGTGKGVCARAIHLMGNRRHHGFIRYQPSGGGLDLIASDLFGHQKGAFTGAAEKRTGLLLEANLGTLFLDEIDELPISVQVMLLGVLQDKVFRSVGNSNEERSDFRLVAAMNQDPEEQIEKGKLRRDLFHRLAHCKIELPPLRARKEDIAILVRHALQALCAEQPLSVFELTPTATDLLLAYNWPGNVRELHAVIEAAAYKAHFDGRGIIEAEDLSLGRHESQNGKSFSELVEDFKRHLIRNALSRSGGNQVQAARELSLDRSTMRRILAREE